MTKPFSLDDYSRMYPRNPKDRSIDRVDYYGSARTVTTEEGVTITEASVDEGTRIAGLCTCGPNAVCSRCAGRASVVALPVDVIQQVEDWHKAQTQQPAESTGALREKRDAIPYDLVPYQEMTDAYARVAEFGAKKYAAWNWSLGLKRVQICSSLLRHVFAYIRGEDRDKESGLLHTDHILWNAAALCHNVHWNLEDGRRREPERAYKETRADRIMAATPRHGAD